MNILIGIGNVDRGDDAVGVYITEQFTHPEWLVLNGGTAPENLTGVVRQHKPEHLVLVDAADMDLPPGAIRRIGREHIRKVGLGTHTLPLQHVINYLHDSAENITLIGIQPKDTALMAALSAEAIEAAEKLMGLLKAGRLDAIETL